MNALDDARPRSRGRAAAIVLLMLTLAAVPARTSATREAPQAMAQRSVVGLLVTFEFDQTMPTTDRISILFSNVAVDLRQAPKSPLTDGVVTQFAFSGRDFLKPNSHVSFSKRVPDRAFLDCRYIRVVNPGSSPWSPTNISLTVAGRRVLDRVSMYPRKGSDAKGGIAGWNRAAWRPVFWETELFRYTHPAKVY